MIIKMGEYEVKKETTYEVDTHDTKEDVKDDVKEAGHEVKEGAGDAKDKLKAGANPEPLRRRPRRSRAR